MGEEIASNSPGRVGDRPEAAGPALPGTVSTAILDALPAHVALLDPEGTITAVNESWHRLASDGGRREPRLAVGRNYLGEIAAARGDCLAEAPQAADGIRDVLAGRTPEFVAEYACHQAAGPRWFRMMVTPLKQGTITGAVVMHIDISELKESEERLSQLNRLYAVLGRINEAITRVREPRALYERACRIAVEEGGMVMAWVGEVDPETSRIRPVAKAGIEDGFLDKVRFPIADLANTGGPFGTAMREGRVAACNDIAADPRMAPVREAALARGYRSAAAVPVKAGGVPVAAFMFYAETVGFFQEPEFRLLAAIGEDISFALESMKTEQDHREAVRALRESEQRYRLLFQKNPHPMWVYDVGSLCFLAVNEAALEQYGYSEAEFLAMRILDLRPEADRDRLAKIIASLGEERRPGSTWRHRKKDGTLIDVEISSDAIVFEGWKARLVLANDITDRLKAERRSAAFSELGRRLNSATTAVEAGDIILQVAEVQIGWDAASFDLCNEDASRIVAVLNIDTIAGEKRRCPPAYDHVPASPLARRAILEGAQLILHDPASLGTEGGIPFGDISRLSASLMFVPVRDGSRVVGVFSVQSHRRNAYDAQDLETLQSLADHCGGAIDRIQAEAGLRASRADMAEAQRIAQMGNWFADLPPDRVVWSDEVCAIHGVPPKTAPTLEECLGFIVPESREQCRQRLAACLRDGIPFDEPVQIVNRTGDRLWLRMMGEPTRDANGEIRRIQGVVQNITAQRRAEERIAEQAALIDEARDAFVVRDLGHRVVFWSKGAERLYGWTAEEATGRNVAELLRIDPEQFRKADKAVQETGAWNGDFQKTGKHGQLFTVDARWTLLRDARQQPRSILTIDCDITEKNRTQAHLFRAQRLDSIGTLAGGIAHDLNNVLALILMALALLKEKLTDPEDEELLTTLQTSAKRGADLVRQVLTFARGIEGRRVEVNLSGLMREIQNIVRDTFPKSIHLRLASPDGLWSVTGDPTQIHQVFLNLCVNARDAMPGGGNLTIDLENVVLDEIYVGMNPGSRTGAHVCVKIADNGTGIPAAIRERIFDPFFTTKEIGKGTGLGLSTTLAIVKSHGGFINLYSETGRGTIFKIYLPANTSAAESEDLPADRPQFPRGRGELVLVVDDEEAIRQVSQKTLERFGYRVLTARHGAEALSIYAKRQAEIAAVVTDMAMPIMDGPALIVALKSMNPAVRIIACSGLNSNGGVAKAIGAGVQHFIPKPYTAEVMLKTLAQLLSERPNEE